GGGGGGRGGAADDRAAQRLHGVGAGVRRQPDRLGHRLPGVDQGLVRVCAPNRHPQMPKVERVDVLPAAELARDLEKRCVVYCHLNVSCAPCSAHTLAAGTTPINVQFSSPPPSSWRSQSSTSPERQSIATWLTPSAATFPSFGPRGSRRGDRPRDRGPPSPTPPASPSATTPPPATHRAATIGSKLGTYRPPQVLARCAPAAPSGALAATPSQPPEPRGALSKGL